jgi:hypothetical protein
VIESENRARFPFLVGYSLEFSQPAQQAGLNRNYIVLIAPNLNSHKKTKISANFLLGICVDNLFYSTAPKEMIDA